MSHQFHLYDVSLENLSEATGQCALYRALDRRYVATLTARTQLRGPGPQLFESPSLCVFLKRALR
jgi:hypothetical protein